MQPFSVLPTRLLPHQLKALHRRHGILQKNSHRMVFPNKNPPISSISLISTRKLKLPKKGGTLTTRTGTLTTQFFNQLFKNRPTCASLWFLKVIQHSPFPIKKSSNSPKGLKMLRKSSSLTTSASGQKICYEVIILGGFTKSLKTAGVASGSYPT